MTLTTLVNIKQPKHQRKQI